MEAEILTAGGFLCKSQMWSSLWNDNQSSAERVGDASSKLKGTCTSPRIVDFFLKPPLIRQGFRICSSRITPSTDVSKVNVHCDWFHCGCSEISTSSVFISKFPQFFIALIRTKTREPILFTGTHFASRISIRICQETQQIITYTLVQTDNGHWHGLLAPITKFLPALIAGPWDNCTETPAQSCNCSTCASHIFANPNRGNLWTVTTWEPRLGT